MSATAVLFDLDGTLLDTLADIALAMNTALAEAGFPSHPVDAYRRMVGSGMRELVRRAAPEAGVRADAVVRRASALYGERPVVHTRPYRGIEDLLARLADCSVPVAILSNKPDDLTQTVVRTLLGSYRFALVRGLVDGAAPKPDPGSALEAAAALGVEPHNVVYLGDSDVDMHTATRAGMRAVGAGWGFRGAAELREAGAELVIDHPLELLEFEPLRTAAARRDE